MLVQLRQNRAVLKFNADDVFGYIKEGFFAFRCFEKLVKLLLYFLTKFVALLHFPSTILEMLYPWYTQAKLAKTHTFQYLLMSFKIFLPSWIKGSVHRAYRGTYSELSVIFRNPVL